jgi:CRP/FNR family transcriptional regulator, cyclic AMP receptor protein
MSLTLQPLLQTHEIFQGLAPEYIALLADCAATVEFAAGSLIFRQGEAANRFYLIRQGQVTVEISAPGKGPITIETLAGQDVLGWSWLFPPYRWLFDARAIAATTAVAIDGWCLRGKCEADPALGYELMKRFSAVMLESWQAAQLQLLDLHG